MIIWCIKTFPELTNQELYDYLALRAEVFIVEQNCPYQDMDGMDQRAWHLLGYHEGMLVSCARMFAPGDCYTETCIGRVISKPSHRKMKIGRELMTKAIQFCDEQFNRSPILISAQLYLEKFYESYGFLRVSDIYLEDNIPHIKMLRQ